MANSTTVNGSFRPIGFFWIVGHAEKSALVTTATTRDACGQPISFSEPNRKTYATQLQKADGIHDPAVKHPERQIEN